MSITTYSTLTVRVVAARDLNDTQLVGIQDPFVTIDVLKSTMKTSVCVDGGTVAEWDEVFKIKGLTPRDVLTQTMRLKCMNKNVTDSTLIGGVLIPLRQFACGKPLTREVVIKKQNVFGTPVDQGLIELEVSLSPPVPIMTLTADVVHARDLPQMQTFGDMDPFVELCIPGLKRKYVTPPNYDGGRNPKFINGFNIENLLEEDIKGKQLRVDVLNKTITSNVFIGEVRIPLMDVADGQAVEKEWQLTKKGKGGSKANRTEAGFIKLRLQLSPPLGGISMELDNGGDSAEAPASEAKVAEEKGEGNMTDIFDASLKGNFDVLLCFLASGIDANCADQLGCTPLHWAAIGGSAECVRLLLKYGANKATQNWSEETPYDYAEANGNDEVAMLLAASKDVEFAAQEPEAVSHDLLCYACQYPVTPPPGQLVFDCQCGQRIQAASAIKPAMSQMELAQLQADQAKQAVWCPRCAVENDVPEVSQGGYEDEYWFRCTSCEHTITATDLTSGTVSYVPKRTPLSQCVWCPCCGKCLLPDYNVAAFSCSCMQIFQVTEPVSNSGLTPRMSNAEMLEQEARDAFYQWDADGSGHIDQTELGNLLKHMGFQIAAIEREFDSADLDKDGLISFGEFVSYFNRIRTKLNRCSVDYA